MQNYIILPYQFLHQEDLLYLYNSTCKLYVGINFYVRKTVISLQAQLVHVHPASLTNSCIKIMKLYEQQEIG